MFLAFCPAMATSVFDVFIFGSTKLERLFFKHALNSVN
jgi:hypothetical protein